MTEDSRIKFSPVDGGDSFTIPLGKVTIGRGTFLQITDKRVSRNHAVLEVDDRGKLIIVPIHSNPCFFKVNGTGAQIMLVKDQPKVLEHGDVVALLPDKLAYRIVYLDQEDTSNEMSVDAKCNDVKQSQSEDEKESELKNNKNESGKLKRDKVNSKLGELAMPLGKSRVLPDWMAGAGDRVGLGNSKPAKSKPVAIAKQAEHKSAKPTPKAKPVANRTLKRPRKPAVSDLDDDLDDDDEDDDEEEYVAKKRGKKSPAAGRPARGKRTRGSDDEEAVPIRRPRAASLKKPKYTDDDFVISDEEMEVKEVSSEDDSKSYSQRRNVDSDFVLDDDESGSDWETKGKSQKSKLKKVKTPTPSRGRRGGFSSGRGGRPKRAKQHHSDEEDDMSDDDDNYVPRVSKRRAAVAAVTRMKESSDYDDDIDDDIPVRRTNTVKASPRGGASSRGRGRPKKQVVNHDDSEEESDSEASPKKSAEGKQVCQYGSTCYRKNPKHFEEFSHPSSKAEDDDDDDDDNDNDDDDSNAGFNKRKRANAGLPSGGGRQKRAAALKQKEKFDAMHQASYDDEDEDEDILPGGTEDDSLADDVDDLNDSDFEVDSDSPVKSKGKSAKTAKV